MADSIRIDFAAIAGSPQGVPAGGGDGPATLVVFAAPGLKLGEATKSAVGAEGEALIARAAAAAKFKGKLGSALDIVAPAGLSTDRLIVIGVGSEKPEAADGNGEHKAREDKGKPFSPTNLGGVVAGKIGRGARALVVFDIPRETNESPADAAADFALGLRLRDYRFDAYKTKKKKDESEDDGATRVTIAVADVAAAQAAATARAAIADGVITARTLVNEPPNVLYPESFAERVKQLELVGLEVEVLDVPAMEKFGMGAILGVSQGSARPGRIVVMRWNGASKAGQAAEKPVAFIGKGVTFDTGGISIKPSSGMEDMKGDMAGAACVVGLMQALAGRKAKVDAIGAIGIVENMPGANAQRPGDIVTSMSGQTIEIINTDAEGRLVLADVCWYVQDKYKPKFMIDLATLTGAILVALGQEHAGLFSNDDDLAEKIDAAGKATGEKVWRMPLGPAYDKIIDSKFADVKNSGGRHAGSITAAHFIGRFVNDTPWAHLDIAGMGMASPSNDINQSWGSGWGVRLLDRLVADNYEQR
ncbi:putative cytosol aminopeptidase [Beijerinckiaceae bacterium RH AL1]|nr:leucyl aminopeptidase [Beijerinckiaceae bacterium]VVB46385.1 putative cytosol aminopeptidase [Beijerinckiaceae bacterium RH CH11]VVB46470.1 putative cytosol aminopeptidase [Beijerinckiaceae bacterium RH AL8]VVC55348.1 putative cytosol aminopeptidase [Beijerinckiaceae bacterium RH AL1]